ncbi:unnamed protein product [Dimorphilus gyrociliatus]|uniref:Uncharacterized protein n=1 Tax=Dimorphilus gyrociliatus TaxID=2664684 RepID=A0A7I8VMX3_9ANNE|nr:unnamed protein product [Dimorphilus gyrociliatus]
MAAEIGYPDKNVKLSTIWYYIENGKTCSLESILCYHPNKIKSYDLATCIIKLALKADSDDYIDSEIERIFYLLCTTWILLVIKDPYVQNSFKENEKGIKIPVPFKVRDFIAAWFHSAFKEIKEHFREEKPLFKNLLNLLAIAPKQVTNETIRKLWPLYFANGTLLYGIRDKALKENDQVILMIISKYDEKIFHSYAVLSTAISKDTQSDDSRRGWKRSANGNLCLKDSIKMFKAKYFNAVLKSENEREIEVNCFRSIVKITTLLIGILHPDFLKKFITWIHREKIYNHLWEIQLIKACLKVRKIKVDLSIISLRVITETLLYFQSKKLWYSTYQNLLFLAVRCGFYLDELQIPEENLQGIASHFQCSIEMLLSDRSYYRLMKKLGNVVSPLSLKTIAIYSIRKSIKPPFSINFERLGGYDISPGIFDLLKIIDIEDDTQNSKTRNDVVNNFDCLRNKTNKIFTII